MGAPTAIRKLVLECKKGEIGLETNNVAKMRAMQESNRQSPKELAAKSGGSAVVAPRVEFEPTTSASAGQWGIPWFGLLRLGG